MSQANQSVIPRINDQQIENIAKKLSEKRRIEIGQEIIEGYKTDKKSRSKWEEQHKNWIKLFGLERKKKNSPWPNASNVGLPMITMACVQFQARAQEALLPSKDLVKVIPLGKEQEDILISERVERYMNFQLIYKIKEFIKSFDTSLLKLPIDGTVIRKTFFDESKNRIVSDYISPTDFVVNFSTRYLEDSERYTQRIWTTHNKVKIKGKAGVYIDTEDLEPVSMIFEEFDEVKQQELKNQGLTEAVEMGDTLNRRLLLEQHVSLDLKDKGKIKEEYIATVDFATGKLLRLVSRRDPETGELMEFFTVYQFIPNPDGFYGYGFGLLLESPNAAVNSIINQLIDAGTLANLGGGFVAKRRGMKRGPVKSKIGEFVEIDLAGGKLSDAVMKFDHSPPATALFQLLGLLQGYSDRLTSVSEIQTGALPKSDTTSGGVLALIEQGMKFFTAIQRRIHRSMGEEFQKVYNLLGRHLNIEEYKKIVMNTDLLVDENGEPIPAEDINKIIRGDFSKNLDVKPVSDPNISSKQEKLNKAQFVYQSVLQNPLTAQNMDSIHTAYVKLLQALEVDDATIGAIAQPPPPQQPPDLPQSEENRIFLNEGMVDALETQNHSEHLLIMDEFENSGFFQEMTATGTSNFEAHRRQHIGFQMVQASQVQQEENTAVQVAQAENVS